MYVPHLECPKCKASHSSGRVAQLCGCGSPLLVRYDLDQVKKALRKEDLIYRRPDLWRYREMLPVKNEKNIVCLGEGMTPLLHLKNLGKDVNIPNLYLKDEGVIPRQGSLGSRCSPCRPMVMLELPGPSIARRPASRR